MQRPGQFLVDGRIVYLEGPKLFTMNLQRWLLALVLRLPSKTSTTSSLCA
jgi:hypothetical protein